MVNKALALHQWKYDAEAAIEVVREAIVLDDECEAAIATCAQLYLALFKFEESADMFYKQAKLTRAEADVALALQFAIVSPTSSKLWPTLTILS